MRQGSDTPEGGGPMTHLLSRTDVERLLTPQACMTAVEDAFRRHAIGVAQAPGILGMHSGDGSFHVKAAGLDGHFAAKLNANFPGNPAFGLPTIQGFVILSSARDGRLLALLDSIAITALRTAAATAVAVKYLARGETQAVLVCGCGGQAAAQLRAVLALRKPKRVYACDQDVRKAQAFASSMTSETGIAVEATADLHKASECAIVITCTTARRCFLLRDMVSPGTFVAAVGADHEEKQEIDPDLMAHATVVTDLTRQASAIGDLHHALTAGKMAVEDVHAELGEVVAGIKRGRASDDEIVIFDSTGTGLQDVAAAIATYRQALDVGAGTPFTFS